MRKNSSVDYSQYYMKKYNKQNNKSYKDYAGYKKEEKASEYRQMMPEIIQARTPDLIDGYEYCPYKGEENFYEYKSRMQESPEMCNNGGEYVKNNYNKANQYGNANLQSERIEKTAIRKKGKVGGFKGTIIVASIIIICFCITMLLADSLTGGYVLAELQSVMTGKDKLVDKYYAVELASYNDMESAKTYSLELRDRGGAGYVINDNGKYRVIAEIYDVRKNADSVIAKLNVEGNLASVYEMDIIDINYSKLPNSVRNISRNVLKYADVCYTELNKIIYDYATGNIEESMAIDKCRQLKDKIKAMQVDFRSNCSSQLDNPQIYQIDIQLTAILGALENLTNTKLKRPNYLCDLRYTNVMIINTHRNLVNSI